MNRGVVPRAERGTGPLSQPAAKISSLLISSHVPPHPAVLHCVSAVLPTPLDITTYSKLYNSSHSAQPLGRLRDSSIVPHDPYRRRSRERERAPPR